MSTTERPNCYKCQYFEITWQMERPYACRAMGFKSRQMPWRVVVRTSGKPCLLFTPKTRYQHQ